MIELEKDDTILWNGKPNLNNIVFNFFNFTSIISDGFGIAVFILLYMFFISEIVAAFLFLFLLIILILTYIPLIISNFKKYWSKRNIAYYITNNYIILQKNKDLQKYKLNNITKIVVSTEFFAWNFKFFIETEKFLEKNDYIIEFRYLKDYLTLTKVISELINIKGELKKEEKKCRVLFLRK